MTGAYCPCFILFRGLWLSRPIHNSGTKPAALLCRGAGFWQSGTNTPGMKASRQRMAQGRLDICILYWFCRCSICFLSCINARGSCVFLFQKAPVKGSPSRKFASLLPSLLPSLFPACFHPCFLPCFIASLLPLEAA